MSMFSALAVDFAAATTPLERGALRESQQHQHSQHRLVPASLRDGELFQGRHQKHDKKNE